jgi:hypothetical protein
VRPAQAVGARGELLEEPQLARAAEGAQRAVARERERGRRGRERLVVARRELCVEDPQVEARGEREARSVRAAGELVERRRREAALSHERAARAVEQLDLHLRGGRVEDRERDEAAAPVAADARRAVRLEARVVRPGDRTLALLRQRIAPRDERAAVQVVALGELRQREEGARPLARAHSERTERGREGIVALQRRLRAAAGEAEQLDVPVRAGGRGEDEVLLRSERERARDPGVGSARGARPAQAGGEWVLRPSRRGDEERPEQGLEGVRHVEIYPPLRGLGGEAPIP